ncbi:MAG: hypothetical protein ABW019_12525 [Chitinophagaceae bacterium]
MKKYGTGILLLCLLAACNSTTTKETKEAPAAIENPTQHPNGMSNGSVISTDTAAMRVDTNR